MEEKVAYLRTKNEYLACSTYIDGKIDSSLNLNEKNWGDILDLIKGLNEHNFKIVFSDPPKDGTLDARIEEFSQDFIRLIRDNRKVSEDPQVTIDSYTMGNSFRKLNIKYEGKATLYLGQAIVNLLDKKELRFVSDRGYGYYYLMD